MTENRFTLMDNFDEGTAICDLTKSPEDKDYIIIILPVYIWALEPLVKLMNELDQKANANI
jgi:hypothetical protein